MNTVRVVGAHFANAADYGEFDYAAEATRARACALPDDAAREYLERLGLEPGSVRPRIGRQTIKSAEKLGTCPACLRPVLLYQPRFAGITVNGCMMLVHYRCAEAIGLWQAARPRDITQAPRSEVDRALYGIDPEIKARYVADMAKVRTPTLYSMLCAYEEHPAERTPAMHWQILIVRREYDQRMARKLSGEAIEVDETLATAVESLERREIAASLRDSGWSPGRIGEVDRRPASGFVS